METYDPMHCCHYLKDAAPRLKCYFQMRQDKLLLSSYHIRFIKQDREKASIKTRTAEAPSVALLLADLFEMAVDLVTVFYHVDSVRCRKICVSCHKLSSILHMPKLNI